MTRLAPRLRAVFEKSRRADALLTALGLLMLPVLLGSMGGLWLDPRTVLGAPVWLKPAKFAASIAVYSLTLAWIFGQLPSHPRTRRFVGRTTAVVMPLELAIIVVQAARGVPSHFNVGTPLDAALFSVMGLAIVLQTLTSLAVAVALWREKLADPALGWALRLAMVITIVGASLGASMTSPRSHQISELRAGRALLSGAHTVGAADGGPEMTVTGWSRQHGDLRVPHFIGLHALQVLPLVALGLRRSRSSSAQRVRLVVVAAGSYTSLLAISLWQALRGQALSRPDALTLGALGVWFCASLALAFLARGQRSATRPRQTATVLPRQTPPLRSSI